MTNRQLDILNQVFDQNPVMDADKYSTPSRPGGVIRLPSHRSGFAASDDSCSEVSSTAAEDAWSPPAWRPPTSSSAWYKHQSHLQSSPLPKSSGRDSASTRDDEHTRRATSALEDIAFPASIPLPRGSESPSKEMSPEPQGQSGPVTRHTSPDRMDNIPEQVEEEEAAAADNPANYIRFSLRADVQQRTAPIEQAIGFLQSTFAYMASSKARLVLSAVALLFFTLSLSHLFSPPTTATPNLIQVAHLVKDFEPLMHYSEHGISQLGTLQETSTAVWDLTESVRQANFTSAPIIVEELDNLYHSLNALATELTGFFATIDGSFDDILMTMDWARREVAVLDAVPASPLSSALSNLHVGLSTVGLLSASNPNDPRNAVFKAIFGVTSHEHNKRTLEHTFNLLLSTIEDNISKELVRSQALFSMYKAIENQFLNLQRATVREADTQETQESEVLASIWQRALGNKAQLHKFEKNKRLLSEVRKRTVANKDMLVKHNGQLMALKETLKVLRQKLVAPLLKNSVSLQAGGVGLGLGEQVSKLEETGDFLKRVRQEQKQKVYEILYHEGKSTSRLEIESA